MVEKAIGTVENTEGTEKISREVADVGFVVNIEGNIGIAALPSISSTFQERR